MWSQHDKQQFLEVANNGQDLTYSGRFHDQVEDNEWGPMARAAQPFDPRAGNFFFEVLVVNAGRNKEVAVGVTSRTARLGELSPKL